MPFRPFRQAMHASYLLLLASTTLLAQTDAGIFREFEFDFSTPGARANAMGRAFVGLADEATAAYSNPAGLSVLESPEFSIEARLNEASYRALTDTPDYELLQEGPSDTTFDLRRIAFASFGFSRGAYTFSAFYVSNLDYRRDPAEERIVFTAPNVQGFGAATYLNSHHVRRIEVNTQGLSVSRNLGKLSLGLTASLARLSMDFEYRTSLANSGFYFLSNTVNSEADHTGTKPAYGLGMLYHAHPRFTLGITYKRQPLFTYTEQLENRENPGGASVPVTFKIPDSVQWGLSWQPTDQWTVLFDIDWTLYKQLLGDNLTQLSVPGSPRIPGVLYHFDKSDYTINQDPNYRFGLEYLYPLKKNILALRAGAFLEPDHKTRFTGTPPDLGLSTNVLEVLYQMQDFLYNNGDTKDNVGLTAGLGFVWHNKIQMDVAYLHSDRYNRAVCSVLYRF